MVEESCFAFESRPLAPLRAGEVLVRNIYLSCDPYLRLYMAERFALGDPIVARAIGEVIATQDPRFSEGDLVCGSLGWETYSTACAEHLLPVDPALGPVTHAIGVRGMNGLTAWLGVFDVGRPLPGETVVVSAAVGAVGSVAGQLARLAGARVVGIVGGEEKVRHAVDVLGYDAAVDRRAARPLTEALAEACPMGIDVYFDNVGGSVLNAVIEQLNVGCRLAMCGNISQYSNVGADEGIGLTRMLGLQATMRWFTINDLLHELPPFERRIAPLVASGKIVYPENVTQGFTAVPSAFVGVFRGENLGKQLVQIAALP
jgi:NADPH-dependent curcumin reductase CurA